MQGRQQGGHLRGHGQRREPVAHHELHVDSRGALRPKALGLTLGQPPAEIGPGQMRVEAARRGAHLEQTELGHERSERGVVETQLGAKRVAGEGMVGPQLQLRGGSIPEPCSTQQHASRCDLRGAFEAGAVGDIERVGIERADPVERLVHASSGNAPPTRAEPVRP